METTLKDLESRRSIRAYRTEQVSDEQLEKIMRAATYAPTGMGRQSPKIVVVQNPEVLARIERMNAAVMGRPDGHPFYGAPTVAIVFADSTIGTYLADGNLVIGNLLNAAHAVGVDSCYIYRAKEVFASDEGKELMKEWGLDEKYVGIGNCLLGYAAAEAAAPAPRKDDYIVYVR